MRILELRAENFKRLSVVEIRPDGRIVEITGENGAGKTSVLDSIWAALGGKNAAPEHPIRLGHESARIQVKIGDDIKAPVYIVERRFTAKDSYIKVTDADGSRHTKPETILKDLIGAIGFDPLEFTRIESKDQYKVLRGLVKFDIDVNALDRKRATIFEERTLTGRLLKNAEGAAAAIVVPELPDQKPDIAALTEQLANVDRHNEGIRQMRRQRDEIIRLRAGAATAMEQIRGMIAEYQEKIDAANVRLQEFENGIPKLEADVAEAEKIVTDAGELLDSLDIAAELERARMTMGGFNLQEQKIAAVAKVTELTRKYDEQSTEIHKIDATKAKTIADAKMPIEGLAFVADTVVYKGLPLSAASAAEQLQVSAAIGTALNPKLRVLIVRDGSLLDSKSRTALYDFIEKNDMDIWIERVDETGETGVVITDGHVKGQEAIVEAFERAESGTKPEGETTVQQAEVDIERMKRVENYVEEMLALAASCVASRDLARLDRAHAEIKVKLANFPEIIAKRWNPVYLEAVGKIRK